MRFKKLIYLKSKPIFIGLLLFFNSYVAQVNLIVNPSFEDTLQIPINGSEFYKCKNWIVAFATPDYFSTFSPTSITVFGGCPVSIPASCLGYQLTHNGNFYVGIANIDYYSAGVSYPKFSNYFELIGGQLILPLIKNHVYDFNMFYNNAEISKYINNNLSAYFSINQFSLNIGDFNPLSQNWYDENINSINPQINHDTSQFLNSDTINWHELKGCFIATGGEKYITIGNFRDNKFQKYKQLNTSFVSSRGNFSYLLIDDLSLYDLGYYSGKAAAKKDTVICNGVSYSIGNNLKDSASIIWWPSAGLSCTNCLNPVASPSVTTKYYVQKTLGCISSKDSITLSVYTPSTSANAGKSATLCVNDKLQLGTNDVNAYSTYTWQPTQYLNCYYCPQPMATAQSNITYTLSRQECSSTSSSTIDIYIDNCELLLPQGFSPNNDGINDDLLINLPFTTEAKLTVFNRWGNVLFEQNSTTQGTNVQYPLSLQLNWDGKAQKGIMIEKGKIVPSGTYFYLIEATHNDGSKKVYKEFVQVVY